MTPYTLGEYEQVKDITAWQLWWEFNKDPYLRLSSIEASGAETGSDDLFLGFSGDGKTRRGWRADDRTVRGEILPAVYKVLTKGGGAGFSENGILCVAKASRDLSFPMAHSLFGNFLRIPHTGVNDWAALALGIAGDSRGFELLRSLARDESAAQEAMGVHEVPESVRAFALYGMGLFGRSTHDAGARGIAVRDLLDVLEGSSEADDLRVAAMISLGLIPLEFVAGAAACVCGDCVVMAPETSLQAQTTYLLRYFTAAQEFPPVLRAHAATTLGRLVSSAVRQHGSDVEALRAGVSRLLLAAIGPHSKEPSAVRRSAVLALGELADADGDELDATVRYHIGRSIASGGQLERRFAMMSLARIGSRGGHGARPWSGTAEVRKLLLRHLSRGRKTIRPWAGLALGVFGHRLQVADQATLSSTDLAIKSALRGARRVDSLGAYALALGLRHAPGTGEVLLAKMRKVKEEGARAYAAIGLGLAGERAAILTLHKVIADGKHHPQWTTAAGIALGLIGDTAVLAALHDTLEASEDEVTRSAVVSALGAIGSTDSVATLRDIVSDDAESDALRTEAMIALGRLADRDVMPWRSAISFGLDYTAATATLTTPEREGVLDFE